MSFPERRNQSVEDNMELPSWRRGSSKKVDTDAPDPDVGENFRRGGAPVQEQATPAGMGITTHHPDANRAPLSERRRRAQPCAIFSRPTCRNCSVPGSITG